MRYVTVLSFSVLAFGTNAAAAQPQWLQRCISQEAEREDLSGSVLVTQGDRTLASMRRGKLASESSPPITESTRFNVGSVSKMFTAVAIGQLVDAGKFQLDEPVGQVVRGLTPEASTVTIRQLLTHTSGLGDFFRPENMAAMLKARTASDIMPLIAGEKPAFPPGSRFGYSNSGFALLGIVVERVSGMTYGEYLKRHIFDPAGMVSTGLDPRPIATLAVAMTSGGKLLGSVGGQLRLIGSDGKQADLSANEHGSLMPAPGATESFGSPAGGLFSTTEDMRRFATALLSGKLLRQTTLREFTSPAVEVTTGKHYGFGFGLTEEGGFRWFGHNGGTLGANAEFWVQPDHAWVISILSNRDPPTATNMARWTRKLLEAPNGTSECSAAAAPPSGQPPSEAPAISLQERALRFGPRSRRALAMSEPKTEIRHRAYR